MRRFKNGVDAEVLVRESIDGGGREIGCDERSVGTIALSSTRRGASSLCCNMLVCKSGRLPNVPEC